MENRPPSRYRLVLVGLVLGVAIALAVAVSDCGGSVARRAANDVAAVAGE